MGLTLEFRLLWAAPGSSSAMSSLLLVGFCSWCVLAVNREVLVTSDPVPKLLGKKAGVPFVHSVEFSALLESPGT